MEGTEEEQRKKKLQAGREKLAHFRQRKTKGESSKAQKKTQKRKNKAVRTDDISKEEDTLIKVEYAEMDPASGAEDITTEDKMTDLEARLELAPDDTGSYAEGFSEPQTPLEDNLSTDLLHKVMQTAVSNRDDIINQLSSNLQKVLLNREEVEEEALGLSSQIQAIQSQLRHSSKVLKSKSPGKTELYEAEQQFSLLQSSLMDQTERMSQLDKRAQELERELENSQKETKENKNQVAKLESLLQEQQLKREFLQEKLERSENAVSLLQQELSDRNYEVAQLKHKTSVPVQTELLSTSLGGDTGDGGDSRRNTHEIDTESVAALVVDLKERLAESETLRESLRIKIAEQMQAFEMERSAWEQKHNDMVANLTLKLQQAEEIAAQDKHEKDRLNQELCDLKHNLTLEAESSKALKLQHERDLQIYDMKLQSLEEEKTKLNQQLSSTWKHQDTDYGDAERVDIKITDKDKRADDFKHELEDLKKNLSRVKARKELENSKAVQLHKAEDEADSSTLASLDKYLIPNVPHQISEFDNSQEDLREHSKFELDSDFMLEQSLDSTMEENVNLLSSPMPITGVLAGGATLGTLLDPESFAVYLSSNTDSENAEFSPVLAEDLVQKCTDLMEKLQDKEQQLQESSEALAEALQKWRDVTAELAATKLERAITNEYWEEEEKMLAEIKSERDDLRKQITDQEQLLREVQEQKSVNEEHFSHLEVEKATLEKRLSVVERELENTLELHKNLEISNLNLGQNLQNSEMARESERQEFDNKLNSKGVEQQLLQEAIRAKETEFYKREENLREEVCLLRQVKEDLEKKLQEEVNHLNSEFEKRMEVSGESWREQIALVNQEHETKIALLKDSHESELQKMYSDLNAEKQQLEELKQQLEKAHSIETEQTQSAHKMEMEALRLSLNNMYTAHLELSQANLHKEKEDALVQLRERLNDKWAQNLAILQRKNLFEVEHLRNEHSQALENLREELSKEISQQQQEHLKEIELLKEKHAAETLELEGKHKKEVEMMQKKYEEEKQEFEQKQEMLLRELVQESLQKLEKKSEELKLVEEESLVKLSNLKELHILEKDEMLSLHLEEKKQWDIKQDALSKKIKDTLEESDLHRKEMLHLEEVEKAKTLEETISKICEKMERMRKEFKNNLEENEELSRQIEVLSEEHKMKISKLQEQHKKDMEILEQEHFIEKRDWEKQENQHSQELEQLRKELSQMAELHLNQIDQLQQKHSNELLHLQDIHSKEITKLQDLLTLEKQEWARQQEENTKKILQLQTQCDNMDAVQNTYLEEKNEWKKQTVQQLEILKKLNEEIAELQEEHLNAVKQLKEQHDREIIEIQERHILENEEWEKQRDQELDLLVNQHSQELKRIGEELLQDSLQKQEEHSKQLEQIREECSKQILALQQQHLIEIQNMNDIHMQEREQWKKEADQCLQQMHINETVQQSDTDTQESKCTHKELFEESHAKENVLEQCEQHSGEIHFTTNLHSQEPMPELIQEQNLQELQDQKSKQTEAVQEHPEQMRESSHQHHMAALVPDPNYEQIQVVPLQQENKFQYQTNTLLKIESSEEIQLLWCQIDRSRASRQELNELKEQLIARSTQLEEIEMMRKDFEQERLLLKAEHEKEMEDLRIYFEQKSSSAEETYREELEILHQRLREMNDDEKVEMTPLNCSTLTLEDSFESEKMDLLQHLTHKLEEHKEELAYSRIQVEERHKQELDNLCAVLTLQYKEDVLNMKIDMSEKHASEIETLKKKHCLELEQLRAKLSKEHVREITQMQLQNTREAVQHGEKTEKTQVLGHNYQLLDTEWLCAEDEKTSELPFSDHHVPLKPLDKNAKMCQTDFESGPPSGSGKQEQGVGEIQMSQLEVLQALHARELVDAREKMVKDLEEITKRLKVEKENALKEAEDRIALICTENAKLQKDLRRETLKTSVSVEYKEAGNDPNLQSEKHLISCISEEQHDQESGDGDLPLKGPDEDKTVSLLELSSVVDLDTCLPELKSHHKKELYTQLTELLQRHEKELQARDLDHETLIQSLEASHLVKLDTLESSYLTEIQKIRDEHSLAVEELEKCLCNKLQEKEREAQDQLEKSRVQWLQQQEQELQRLRQELASVQLAKFQAMAEELEAAHREDLKQKLDQQLFLLEEEKKQALDILQEEVLRMEAQNQLALQELRDLHKVEVEHQTIKLQEELKTMTEDLHKQELLIGELASERQALSTELQGKSDLQLRYQEEIELLKCQSEMLLEQQITLLKDEFRAEKRSALQELEEKFSKDIEKVRAEHQMEKDHFMKQLEGKNTLVLQLQDRVSALTKETDASQSQMDMLVQRRERENQEGEHLVAMLQSDSQTAQQEHRKLQDSCQRLLKIFADVLKSTLVTEDLISKKIGVCLDNSLSKTDDESTIVNLTKSSDKNRLSPDCETEHSLMSTDEGYELSEYLCDSVLGSLEVGLENEEKIIRMGHRLRAAVERLLDMVTDSTLQLEQTRDIQKCFEEEFKSRNQDMAQVVVQNRDLLKQLTEETEEKNQLEVELHKSKGLIEGFTLEKATLEEALLSKESSEHQLILELEKSREQLKILTQEPSVSGKEKEVLQRLQEVLSGSDIEAELLKETERLLKEELELHCQAKQDRSNLISQMKMLETELEEQMARNQELMKKTSEMTDLQQQIQSLEKQLKSQRHFMDEQAIEREHERDEFQQEIENLEEQLKQALKSHGDCKAYGIETLEARVKEKAADCKVLLQGREHLEQQIKERNEEIDKMMIRIQELEQAALSNADAAKKCSQLEVDFQKMQKMEKELLQDKEALQQQQYNNVLQISALQSKLDEARHRVPVEGAPDHLLKQELQAEREALQRKEKEAESLVEQLEQFREELLNKTEEVFQLNMQLDIQRKQYEQAVQQAQEEYLRLKNEMSTMHSRSAGDGASSTLQLPQALLQEKNQEIDHLNEQILRLQQEATCSQSAEVEELRSLVELLRSDLDRLRKDKEEEVEQLHEVIEKLQQELEQLGPNRHEISDSQESLDQLGLGEVENLQRELRKGAQQLQGRGTKQDGLDNTDPSYNAEMEALQQELEEKEALRITEIEVLERNLHNVQQSSRQHEQALETLRVQHGNLQEESEFLQRRFSEQEKQIVRASSQLQELQDRLREKDGFLMEKELLVQTLQAQNAGDRAEFANQLAQSALSLEAAKIDLQKMQEESISCQNLIARCSNEQKKKEEEYQREIQNLKQLFSDWEEKAQIITEEVQTQTEDEFMELRAVPRLVALKEQLNTAENLASMREADLHSAQTQLANMKQELEELHAECERREAKAQDVLQQLQKREMCVAGLQTHSQNLGTQVKKLQDALLSQEAMIVLMSGDIPKKNFEDLEHKPDLSRPGKARSFSESLTDLSTWDSPEMVRKQEEAIHSLRAFTPFSELSIDHSAELIRSKSSCTKRPEYSDLLGSSTPSLSESNFSTQRASPLRDAGHTDYGSCDDLRSSRDDQMDSEKTDELDYGPEVGSKTELNYMENLLHIKQKIDSVGTSGLSPQLQRMLNMVHEESCKILELSEHPLESSIPDSSDLAIKLNTWQKEKQSLQETIQSLSSALVQAAGKGEQESITLDWRRDLLQSVQALLESERKYLRLELQSDIRHGSGDKNLLSEKVEHLIKEQEEQKRLVLEHVLAVDRSSLLSEIQELRSQLRMAHLQNQEKLQKLQDTLTSTEERGHTREHQLRRQVELLEYKLEQEASIAEDLKGSLLREKERTTEQYKGLLQEQATVSQLRSELEEKVLEMEGLRKSQKELQKELHLETSKLRDELENKVRTMSISIKTLQTESQVEKQRFDEEKTLIQRTLEIKEKSLQEASLSLEEHKMLNAKMSAALSQEQTFCSNLKKELEIEQSRGNALLAQEHSKLSEAAKELEKEKQHSLSLSNTLTLERSILEQLRQQHARELSKEEERQQEHKLILTLQSELEDERKRARDLAAMIEKTQQQAVHAKRQLESEVQVCREEMQKEREAGVKLRGLLDSLQSQKWQLDSVLEQQRERELQLQKDRDQYQAQVLILQEKERTWVKELEQETKRLKQAEAGRAREEEQDRRIMDLQLQHERDRRRIQELQQMLADLEEQERALASRKSRLWNDTTPTKNAAYLATNVQRVWQQLLHAVLQVKKWVQNKGDRIYEGFPDEAEVTALLDSLSELKSKLQKGYVQQPVQSPPSSVTDVLKRENEELASSVSQLTQEKLELKSQLSKLAKSHQETLQKTKDQVHADVGDSILEAERAVWLREKRLLQIALKHAESELDKATLENRPQQDVPNSKMQRLYRKYLRAESFRKALVYQKKYLLLLLGGFQACEKATLSLIARMGVYPSPADLQDPSKCQTGLGKFRSAVRAVIAISRLKFLVRKWHKVYRKCSDEDSVTRQVPVNRMDVLQQLGSTTVNSPPTRDLPFSLYRSPNASFGMISLKPSQLTPKWAGHSPALTPERSYHSSQDPEHSITDYIHHLEMVQRRLGGLQNGPSPEHPRYGKYAWK